MIADFMVFPQCSYLKSFVTRIFFFFSILTAVSFPAFALHLSEEAQIALEEAKKLGNYKIKVVEKTRGSVTQAVIIVGENHINLGQNPKYAENLFQYIKLIGTEGTANMGPSNEQYTPILARILLPSEMLSDLSPNGIAPSDSTDLLSPIKMAQERFTENLKSRTSAEAWFILQMLNYEINPDQYKSGWLPLRLDIYIELGEALLSLPSLGLSRSSIIEADHLDDLFLNTRKELLKDIDLVQLEINDPVPQELINWKNSCNKAFQAHKIGLYATGALLASLLVQYVIPDPVTACISTAALVAISAVPNYIRGTFDELLPRQCQIEHQYLFGNPDLEAGMMARNKIMSKNIEKALRLRPQAESMLVFVGENHISGMVKILNEEYGYNSVD